MLRACFSAYYWVHVLHIWGSLGVIVVFVVIYRPWDLGKNGKSSLIPLISGLYRGFWPLLPYTAWG